MLTAEAKLVSLSQTDYQTIFYGKSKVGIHSARPGYKINIEDDIEHLEDFHGIPQVDQVVRFGGAFRPLIGRHEYNADWKPDILPQQQIYIYEQHSNEAQHIARKINELASRFIADKALYNDKKAGEEYYELARAGYDLMREQREAIFGLGKNPTEFVVSLERGGLVSTRLGLGLSSDARIENEVRVITKRTHLKGEPDDHLTVTVVWRGDDLTQLNKKAIQLYDFVNPASGASTAGFLVAAQTHDVVPEAIAYHAIAATRGGVLFNRSAHKGSYIDSSFEMLFESVELNPDYYLIDRPVADAGNALRHYLPAWYKS